MHVNQDQPLLWLFIGYAATFTAVVSPWNRAEQPKNSRESSPMSSHLAGKSSCHREEPVSGLQKNCFTTTHKNNNDINQGTSAKY